MNAHDAKFCIIYQRKCRTHINLTSSNVHYAHVSACKHSCHSWNVTHYKCTQIQIQLCKTNNRRSVNLYGKQYWPGCYWNEITVWKIEAFTENIILILWKSVTNCEWNGNGGPFTCATQNQGLKLRCPLFQSHLNRHLSTYSSALVYGIERTKWINRYEIG